jgi:hypothetical protein
MAREYLYLVIESAYGTPKATPTLGTDAIYCRLSGGNAFTIVGDPVWYEIMYGGGFSVPAIDDADQHECVGQLTTELYGSQAVFMSNWAMQRINAGQTSPWTTTEPPGDLPSVSAYHGVQRSDGTIKRLRFPGTKVENWKIECSRDQKYARLTLGLRAQKWVGNTFDSSTDPDATEFPLPAETSYPTDPFRFIDMAGHLTIGSSRTMFSSVSITGTNKMDPRWFEGRFLSLERMLGREVTLDSTVLYKPTPDDLTSYQNLVALASSVGFDNGTNSLTINLNAKSKLRKVTKKLDLDKVYELPLSLRNIWDPNAAADITVTAA